MKRRHGLPVTKTCSLLVSLGLAAASARASDLCQAPTQSAIQNPWPWQLAWSDEFDYEGLPDPAKWKFDVGGDGWGNEEDEFYTDRIENARVTNGSLFITARRENYQGNRFTSARITTQATGGYIYGRYEFRAKLPNALGSWPAIWFMPVRNTPEYDGGGWPNGGEIDLAEHVAFRPDIVSHAVHTRGYNWFNGNDRFVDVQVKNVEDWHTYALNWSPTKLEYFIDDQKTGELLNDGTGWESWPFDKDFYIIMNVAVGGGWGGSQGLDEKAFSDPKHPVQMVVDYARIYRPTDASFCATDKR